MLSTGNQSSFRGLFLASLLLIPWMISTDSFWIDEGGTGVFAMQPSLSAWWDYLSRNDGSDSQMPLAMFFAWLTGHFIGTQEWQLRAINAGWAVLALFAMAVSGRKLGLPWLPLLFAVQPFFWYYTNEARPFALQICIGAFLLVGTLDCLDHQGRDSRWAWILAVAGVTLGLTTMLAPVFLVALALGLGAAFVKRGWKPDARAVAILVCGMMALVPVAIYYAKCLLRGAKGAQIWEVGPLGFGFVAYEFVGLAGLGPAVSEIREGVRAAGPSAFLLAHWAEFFGILIFSAAFIWLVVAAFRKRDNPPGSDVSRTLGIVLSAFIVLIVLASFAAKKAFWARHFAPVFPFYIALFGLVLSRALRNRSAKVPALVLVALFGASSAMIRFHPRHKKEDYRSAAAMAKSALSEGRSVWWLSNSECADYYGLPTAFANPAAGKATIMGVKMSDGPGRHPRIDLNTLPAPDVIVLSKPDIFDSDGTARKIIATGGYRTGRDIRGFTVFQR